VGEGQGKAFLGVRALDILAQLMEGVSAPQRADHAPAGPPDPSEHPPLPHAAVRQLPIKALVLDFHVRVDGLDEAHAARLAETSDPLPPILVHASTLTVVDGHHRIRASRLRGDTHVDAVLVDGDLSEAYALAVALNCRHGLPLSRKDRRAAIEHLLETHPEWSDRRIAYVTGTSHKTVGIVRRPTGATRRLDTREGQDGRRRPLDPSQGRLRAAQLLTERPHASLREIAAAAGVSPTTVLDVRKRQQEGLPVLARAHDRPDLQRQADCTDAPDAPRPDGRGFRRTDVHEAARGAERDLDRPRNHEPSGGRRGEQGDGGCDEPSDGRSHAVALPRTDVQGALRGHGEVDCLLNRVSTDPALRATSDGRHLLQLLSLHAMGTARLEQLIKSVPTHRRVMIRDIAHSCAESWLYVAERLDHHTLGAGS
jgi:ParB-like chromosome segregation protein Spo0J